jgi:hypothetical protein
MTRKKLVTMIDNDYDEPVPTLEYEGYGFGEVINSSPTPTVEELADFCDANAGSRNNHDFVGSHRVLAALLYARLGRESATGIMREIAEFGGLDGMSGGWWGEGNGSAFADFGIKDCWAEWSLEHLSRSA